MTAKNFGIYALGAISGAVLYFCGDLLFSPIPKQNGNYSQLELSTKKEIKELDEKHSEDISSKEKQIDELKKEMERLKQKNQKLEQIIDDNQSSIPEIDINVPVNELNQNNTNDEKSVDKKSFKYRGPNEKVVLELDHEIYKPELLLGTELLSIKEFYENRYKDVHEFENEDEKNQFLEGEMNSRGYVGDFPLTDLQRQEMLRLIEGNELINFHGRDAFSLKNKLLRRLLEDSSRNGITPEVQTFLRHYDELNLARRYLVNDNYNPDDVSLTPENWAIYARDKLANEGVTLSAPLELYLSARHQGHFDEAADLIMSLRQ